MCLIVIAHGVNPEFPLLLAANRDEFYARPASAASFWRDQPNVLAGRDLEAGGTWLGINRSGKFAAVTNYRDMEVREPGDGKLSRGELTTSFLTGNLDAQSFLAELQTRADRYAGFNLLLGSPGQLWYFSNRDGEPRRLEPGIYGLSNHLLDTPWPKVELARRKMERYAHNPENPAELLQLVAESSALEGDVDSLEAHLSAQFIVTGTYGTRASTAIRVGVDSRVEMIETCYAAGGIPIARARFSLRLNQDLLSS